MKKIVDVVEEFFLKIFEKIGLKKFTEWYRAHKVGMRYLVFGGLATLVNIIAYSVCYYIFHIQNSISNVLAWVISALFAYITNKFFVFDSKVETKKALLYEITSFFSCRILTLIIDEGLMIITVDKLGWNAMLMKIIVNIVVIILNYVFSKLIIFKKGKE